MTAEEYIKEKNIKDTLYDVENPIPNQWIKGGLSKLLQDFARLKCEEQRELCAKEIKRNAVIFDILGINQETILNSPEPEI